MAFDCTIQVLPENRLQPGDKIIIESPKLLTHQQVANIRQTVKEWWGCETGDRILLLHGGMTLRILSTEESNVSTSNP